MKTVPSLHLVVRIKTPRVRSSFAGPVFCLAGLALFAAVLTAWHLRSSSGSAPLVVPTGESILKVGRVPRVPERIYYPYSVVPGGVANADQALAATRRDAVVRAHYDGIRLEAAWMTNNPHLRFAHVSYRKGNRIYWTRNRVRIAQGERLLTDGDNAIRGRCGNRLAETPLGDVEPEGDAPGEEVLDSPVLDEEPMETNQVLVGTLPSEVITGLELETQPDPEPPFTASLALYPDAWWYWNPYLRAPAFLLSAPPPAQGSVSPESFSVVPVLDPEETPPGAESNAEDPAEVPEPSAFLLLATGLIAIHFRRCSRRRALSRF